MKKTHRSLLVVMAGLYRSEINSSVSCFWDGGFDVRLGDAANGYKAEAMFEAEDLANDAGEWLHEQALKFYPESDYAKGVA